MRTATRIGKLTLVAIAAAWLGAASVSAAPNTGRLSLSGGIDITTAYFFRGILQERDGAIFQPYLELGVSLYKGEDDKGEGNFSGLSLFGGTWASLHTEETNHTASSLDAFYEQDWYGGIQLQFMDNKITTRAFYIAYTSPSDAFRTVQEVDLSAALDDSEWLGAFALKPSILFATETENSAMGPERGEYMEFGVAPGFPIVDSEDFPVTLTFPNKLGISLDDYYEVSESNEDTFGYYSTGVKVSFPLTFIPEDYGSWSASGGATLLVLGTNTKNLNDKDSPWVVGTWGVSMAY